MCLQDSPHAERRKEDLMKREPLAGFGLGLALVAAAVILVLRRRNRVTTSRVVYEAPSEEPRAELGSSRAELGGRMTEQQYQQWLAGIGGGWETDGDWQDSSTLPPDPRDIGRGEWGGEDEFQSFTLAELGIEDDLPPNQPADEPPFTPFSLADLGLSEEEIAALEQLPVTAEGQGKEATMTANEPKEGMNVDECLPFSLKDLGLTDEEIAALGLSDTSITPVKPAKPQPVIAHVNDRAFSVRRLPPTKPVTFRYIWWRPLWKQEVVIGQSRFYFWLYDWATDFGLEGPVGTMITGFARYGWSADDLIRYYLDDLHVANKVKQPFRYGRIKWSEVPETIVQLQQSGEALRLEGKRLRGLAHQLLEAEESALAASRVNASLGQPKFYVPCTCAIRREMEHYADLFIEAGRDDLERAAKLIQESHFACASMDELRKMGVTMPPPFDKPFNR